MTKTAVLSETDAEEDLPTPPPVATAPETTDTATPPKP